MPGTTTAPRRNDPCPCGSGKRFKECHGSLASQTSPADAFAAGQAAHQRGDREGARRLYEQAIRESPGNAPALHYLGVLSWQEGAHADALDLMQRSIAADARVPEFHNNLALLHRDRGDLAAAEASLREALRVDPGHGEAYNSLGLVQKDRGEYDAALGSYRRAEALMPARAEFAANRAMVEELRGDARAAIEAYDVALRADPARAARWSEVEHLYAEQRALDAVSLASDERGAIARARVAARALGAWGDPVTQTMLEHRRFATLALAGEAPWAHHFWRAARLLDWQLRAARRLAVARFALPARLDGVRLEVLGEEGLGDTLFFLGWLPALRARGATIALRADRRLEPLLRPTGLIAEFRDPDDGTSRGLDTVLAGDLPGLLQDDVVIAPALVLEARAAPPAEIQPGKGRRIAITWRGGTVGGKDGGFAVAFREVPLEDLLRAVDDGTSLVVSVQRLPRVEENELLRARLGGRFVDLSSLNADLEAMLGLLGACEEYVGVSNTNFHLRKCLGMNGRLLVPFPPEWRLYSGDASPWFPGFTIFRQQAGGDWGAAFAALARLLAAR